VKDQQIYIFEGPDRCGKTEMATELAKRLDIPYFKAANEKENWTAGLLKDSLWFDYTLPQFLKATKVSCVFDRSYPSEWVYSQVFGRKTNMNMLEKTDKQFADLGAKIFIPYRTDYTGYVDDVEEVNGRFGDIHSKYLEFEYWTNCSTMWIDVTRWNNNLDEEMKILELYTKYKFDGNNNEIL